MPGALAKGIVTKALGVGLGLDMHPGIALGEEIVRSECAIGLRRSRRGKGERNRTKKYITLLIVVVALLRWA